MVKKCAPCAPCACAQPRAATSREVAHDVTQEDMFDGVKQRLRLSRNRRNKSPFTVSQMRKHTFYDGQMLGAGSETAMADLLISRSASMPMGFSSRYTPQRWINYT